MNDVYYLNESDNVYALQTILGLNQISLLLQFTSKARKSRVFRELYVLEDATSNTRQDTGEWLGYALFNSRVAEMFEASATLSSNSKEK